MRDAAAARALLAGFLTPDELLNLSDAEVLQLAKVVGEALPQVVDTQLDERVDEYRLRILRHLNERQPPHA